MPDGSTSSGSRQIAQRGFPGGRFPGGRFPRFPRRSPVRVFPRPFFPFFFGFPADRCFYIDRFGRCCDRYGRCFYRGGYGYPYADAGSADGWYGVAGDWDMAPDMDGMDGAQDADSMTVYNDMTDYDY